MNRLLVLAILCATALTFAACSKGSNATTTQTASTLSSSSPAPGGVLAQAAGPSSGASVYSTNCITCHQATGQGSPGMYPPLAENPVVTGDPARVIHIVKYGLTGPIKVKGNAFNGQMPAWGSQLSNAQIAAAVTYVRSSWGNKASRVTTAQVAAVTK